MRILLQHVRTQLYLRTRGIWTANHFEALDFQHSQKALEFAREHNIEDIQIAVKFTDGQFDEVVSLPPFHAAHSPVKRASSNPSGY